MKQLYPIVAILLVLMLASCELFNRTFRSGVDTEAFPTVPETFSSPDSGSRSLIPADDGESDGVYYGTFQPLHQVGANHNVALSTLDDYLLEYDNKLVVETSLSSGPYSRRVEYIGPGDRPIAILYDNPSQSAWSFVSTNPDETGPLSAVQCDYAERNDHTYGRIIFYMRETGDVMDLTEIWEYADAKQAKVSRLRGVSTSTPIGMKSSFITDLSNPTEPTTALLFSVDDSGTITDQAVGVVDLTMSAVLQGITNGIIAEYPTAYTEVQTSYPSFPDPDIVADIEFQSAVTPAGLAHVSYDRWAFSRYSGFD